MTPSPGAVTRQRLLPLAIVIRFVVVTLIWGTTWYVIRDQLGVVPPSWSVTYRFLAASATMFAYALWRREPLGIGPSGQAFALTLALPQFVLNFNFVYRSEAYIPSGLVSVIFALLIVPNALMGRIFLGQRLSRGFLIGSGIALIGIALLILNQMRLANADAGAVLTGTGFVLLGVFCASVANVMQGSQRAKRWPMATMLAWAMLWGALIDAAFAWITVGPPVFDMRSGYIFGLLYLGVLASAVAFTAYFTLVRAIGPARAAYSSVLIPVLAMIISTMFEGYRWSLLASVGAVVALVGLVIALSSRRA